jgi:P27 family predicted phage terminase small subunit
MAVRGRTPKPTVLKLLEGNPGKRALNRHEPKLEVKEPVCPEHLDEAARKEWNRIVPVLLRMRVLTEADQVVLACLCQTYSTLMEAQAKLKQAGLLYQTRSGYVQQSPLLSIINNCVSIIARLSAEFGLTPAARVRLHATAEDKPKNKWAEIG